MKDHSPLRVIPIDVKKTGGRSAFHGRPLCSSKPPRSRCAIAPRRSRFYKTPRKASAGPIRKGISPARLAAGTSESGTFTSFDRVLWIGAFCVMLFECLCAVILASMTLAIPTPAAVVVGIALTAVFTLTMKAVWHLHIAADEVQPRRALATLYRWIMPLAAAWAAALIVALLLPRRG